MKPENPTIEICPGITRRTVAHGNTMYQMLATLAAGSQMPAHSHPQEQIVHILEGKMRLIVEGVPHELSNGRFVLSGEQCSAWCGNALGNARARYVQSAAS